jgi:hypothetical protein
MVGIETCMGEGVGKCARRQRGAKGKCGAGEVEEEAQFLKCAPPPSLAQ